MMKRFHPLFILFACFSRTLGEDSFTTKDITNKDNTLTVYLTPLRLNIFETPQFLSASGIKAVVDASGAFATKKLKEYFENQYGDEYLLNAVNFEAASVTSIVSGNQRKRRVFEVEESKVDAANEKSLDVESSREIVQESIEIERLGLEDKRDLQRTVYGTSFELHGNVTFQVIPSAPSDECNEQVTIAMQKYWGLRNFILDTNHNQLLGITMNGITTTVLSPAPTKSPSKKPTASPSKSPTKYPTKRPTTSPTKAPSPSPSKFPTKSPSKSPTTSPSSSPHASPSASPTEHPTRSPSSKPTVSPTKTPTKFPTTEPSEGPTLFPVETPSRSPTRIPTKYPTVTASPTDSPTESPSKSPNGTPSRSPTKIPTSSPSKAPTETPTTSASPTSSAAPTNVASSTPSESKSGNGVRGGGNGIPDSATQVDNELNLLPALLLSLGGAACVVFGAAFYLRRREGGNAVSGRGWTRRLSDEKLRREDHSDKDLFEFDLNSPISSPEAMDQSPYDVAQMEAGESKEEITPSLATFSIDSSRTLKTANFPLQSLDSVPNVWSLSPDKSPRSEASAENHLKPNSSTSTSFDTAASRAQVDDEILDASERSPLTPSKKKLSPPVSPTLKRLFESKRSNKSAASPHGSSPVIRVTPSKVTKEEFEKSWDADIPFNWAPSPNKATKKTSSRKMRTSEESDVSVDGSFPTFSDPKIPPRVRSQNNSIVTSTNSQAESSGPYLSAHDIHSLDWSNKGSDFDGTSAGDSSMTEGWDHADSSRQNVNVTFQSNLDTTSGSANFHTPKSKMSHLARSSTASGQSSPSNSLGSSKQLIDDLVWLEKKIAAVKARVDRLDGEESQTTGSPPLSPHSLLASPIKANIVCRDVLVPPGKLSIVIHSTRDGPCIHSVKRGSVLEGRVFAGDLIIAVNDADTREMNAEDVMEIMSHYANSERKLTLLHSS